MMPWIETVHITKIDLAPPSDSFFPNLDALPDWCCVEAGPWQEENGGTNYLEITLDVGFGVTDELKETITIRRGDLYALFESRVKEEN